MIGSLALYISMALALLSVSPASSEPPETEKPEIVGADIDEYGCIGSAGYNWSAVKGECVRLFDIGTGLQNVSEPESSVIAFIIEDDKGDVIELFAVGVAQGLLLNRNGDVWTDRKNMYRLTKNPLGTIKVSDATGVILFERQVEPSTALDTVGNRIQDFGFLVSSEDAGYPIYNVEVQFPEGNVIKNFLLNIESIALDPHELDGLVRKFVDIHYTSDLDNMLIDIRLNGLTLFGEYAGELDSSSKQVEGILSGAELETAGDLPDEITIMSQDGKKTQFEYFIGAEMVKANGKRVTAYYEPRVVNQVTFLKGASKD